MLNNTLVFIFFCFAACLGAVIHKHTHTYTIQCPEGKLVQAMSDGNEVLCIYSKEPMKEKRTAYKKGKLNKCNTFSSCS